MVITAKLYALIMQAFDLKAEIEILKKDSFINASYLSLLEESLSYFTRGERPFFSPEINYGDINIRVFNSSSAEVRISEQIITSKKIKKKILKYIYKKFNRNITYLQKEINYKKYTKEHKLYLRVKK